MATLTGSIDDLLTPSLLGRLSAQTGIPDKTVGTGIKGAVASIMEGLLGKAKDPRAMGKVAELISETPAEIDPERLLDGSAPLARTGNQLLGVATEDVPGLAQRLSQSLGIGAKSATGLLAAAAGLAMSAFRNFSRSRGGLDASSLASSLIGESRAIHDAVPAGLLPAAITTEARTTVRKTEPMVTRTSRAWWLLLLIPLAVLAYWMFSRGGRGETRAPAVTPRVEEPRVAPSAETRREEMPAVTPAVPVPEPTTTAPTSPAAAALSFAAGSPEDRFLAHVRTPMGPDATTWFELEDVQFDTAKAMVRSDAANQLDNVAKILVAYPSLRIKVGGYTDKTGSPEANQKLSTDRAESVRQALIMRGIDGSRIEAEGYGGAHAVEETAGAAQSNRRAAIRVIAR